MKLSRQQKIDIIRMHKLFQTCGMFWDSKCLDLQLKKEMLNFEINELGEDSDLHEKWYVQDFEWMDIADKNGDI